MRRQRIDEKMSDVYRKEFLQIHQTLNSQREYIGMLMGSPGIHFRETTSQPNRVIAEHGAIQHRWEYNQLRVLIDHMLLRAHGSS